MERADNEPPAPIDFDMAELPRPVRAQLRSLPKELATVVGAHLVMAGTVIDEDPELALAHALAARRRAARLAIVREATAEAAYAAGQWSIALREYRAVRRMSGNDETIPVIADCERALGRPREALKLAAEAAGLDLSDDQRVEMALVEAGARVDLGQASEALRLLKSMLGAQLGAAETQSRLMYAYADLLEAAGQTSEARTWFARSLQADPESEAEERLAALEGRSPAERLDPFDMAVWEEDVPFDDLADDDLADDDLADEDSVVVHPAETDHDDSDSATAERDSTDHETDHEDA